MPNPNTLQIIRVPISSGAWYPITLQYPCNYWVCSLTVAGTVCSDTGDPNTEQDMNAGAEIGVTAGAIHSNAHHTRFMAGDIVLYAKTTSGAGEVILRSTK